MKLDGVLAPLRSGQLGVAATAGCYLLAIDGRYSV